MADFSDNSVDTPLSDTSLLQQNYGSLSMLNWGSALKTIGVISNGVSMYNSYNSKAQAEGYNAQIASGNASIIGQETASNTAQLNLLQQQKIGQQRANLAQANIGPISSGSSADALLTSERNANMQLLTDQYRGSVAKTSSQNSAALDQYYAKVASSNASTSLLNAGAGAMSQLLSGYNKYQQGGF